MIAICASSWPVSSCACGTISCVDPDRRCTPALLRSNGRPGAAGSGFPVPAPLRPLGPARRTQVVDAGPARQQSGTSPRTRHRRMPRAARLGCRSGHRMLSRRRREAAPFLPLGARGARATPGCGMVERRTPFRQMTNNQPRSSPISPGQCTPQTSWAWPASMRGHRQRRSGIGRSGPCTASRRAVRSGTQPLWATSSAGR
jgi:hypothetical protein